MCPRNELQAWISRGLLYDYQVCVTACYSFLLFDVGRYSYRRQTYPLCIHHRFHYQCVKSLPDISVYIEYHSVVVYHSIFSVYSVVYSFINGRMDSGNLNIMTEKCRTTSFTLLNATNSDTIATSYNVISSINKYKATNH